eukprot:TRINITY_DN19734_c0_g1_i1.p1 TRINITY_DN19734_c0_g1~~TRINITY_DN19734_c0_g1_i1.p1  ORF type:complete len:223 (+),score=4.62 TRINITY_DN19734_c0_g1_i1:938-1606(+)
MTKRNRPNICITLDKKLYDKIITKSKKLKISRSQFIEGLIKESISPSITEYDNKDNNDLSEIEYQLKECITSIKNISNTLNEYTGKLNEDHEAILELQNEVLNLSKITKTSIKERIQQTQIKNANTEYHKKLEKELSEMKTEIKNCHSLINQYSEEINLIKTKIDVENDDTDADDEFIVQDESKYYSQKDIDDNEFVVYDEINDSYDYNYEVFDGDDYDEEE